MKIFKAKLQTTSKELELGEYSVNDIIYNNKFSTYENAYNCLLKHCKDVDSDEYIVLAMISEETIDNESDEYIDSIDHVFVYQNNTLEKFDENKSIVKEGDWIVYAQGKSLECGLIGNIHKLSEEDKDESPIYVITEDSGENDCSPHSHIKHHNIVAKVDEKIVELILATKYIANIKRRYVLSKLKIEVYKQEIKDLDKQIKDLLKK